MKDLDIGKVKSVDRLHTVPEKLKVKKIYSTLAVRLKYALWSSVFVFILYL